MADIIPFPTSTPADQARLAVSILRLAEFRYLKIISSNESDNNNAIDTVIDKEYEILLRRLPLVKRSDMDKVTELIYNILKKRLRVSAELNIFKEMLPGVISELNKLNVKIDLDSFSG